MQKRGVRPNIVTYNVLIDGYGNFKEAKRLFEGIEKRGLRPYIITYNVLIDGYGKKRKLEESYRLFKEMENIGVSNTLINEYRKKENLEEAKWLFEKMEKKGVRYDIVTYTTLIDGYYTTTRKGR
ncbi:hypothetical protein Dsin_015813 [Dipteronia sinensis]|uniref:Pentatricopeptide repeat-containing protein n=1 Tax=Dipteronia sinensis TaxID=43782 RepID=A0AAE0AD49_9ROSI|nr:hypothetical protein Dsin_015813 [Dipteronia sinensis]